MPPSMIFKMQNWKRLHFLAFLWISASILVVKAPEMLLFGGVESLLYAIIENRPVSVWHNGDNVCACGCQHEWVGWWKNRTNTLTLWGPLFSWFRSWKESSNKLRAWKWKDKHILWEHENLFVMLMVSFANGKVWYSHYWWYSRRS